MTPGSIRTLTTLVAALIGAVGLILAAYIGTSSHREEEELRGKIARLEQIIEQQKQAKDSASQRTDPSPSNEPMPAPAPSSGSAPVPVSAEAAAPESKPIDDPVPEVVQQNTNRQIVKEMLFELAGCEADGTTVWCQFTLENHAPADRQVQLEVMELSSARSRDSRVFDSAGNEYHGTGGSLAGKTVLDWEGYSYIRTTAPPQVPLKASIRFEGVPEGSELRLLRIIWGDRNYDRFPVDFRDPRVTKRE